MTSSKVVAPTAFVKPLWLDAVSDVSLPKNLTVSGAKLNCAEGGTATERKSSKVSLKEALSSQADKGKNIQLATFRDRLTLRRQHYVPLGDRSPLQTLAPLFAGGQLEIVAEGLWNCVTSKDSAGAQDIKSPEQWVLAKLVELEHSPRDSKTPSTPAQTTLKLLPYLYIGMTQAGDLSLRLLPACHHLGAELALSTLDGVGREFKISAQASFIQRIAQLQEMQLELGQELTIRRSLYNTLAQAPLRPSQALRYFDRLLDESPYIPSRTPASDRLIQRRQLFKSFSTSSPSSLWDAYAAVAQWVNHTAPGDAAQRWHSCCHGPGETMLRQALAYAVALQYDQQDNAESSQQPRISGAQRSLAASDALQNRIQQLRNDEAIARQTTSKLIR